MKPRPPRPANAPKANAAEKLRKQINNFKTERTGRFRSQQSGTNSFKNNISAVKDDVVMTGKLFEMKQKAEKHQQKLNRRMGIKDPAANQSNNEESDFVSNEDMIIATSKLLKPSNQEVKYVRGPLKQQTNPLQQHIDTLNRYEKQSKTREQAQPKGLHSLRTL